MKSGRPRPCPFPKKRKWLASIVRNVDQTVSARKRRDCQIKHYQIHNKKTVAGTSTTTAFFSRNKYYHQSQDNSWKTVRNGERTNGNKEEVYRHGLIDSGQGALLVLAAGAISLVGFNMDIMKSDQNHIYGDSILGLFMAKQPVLCDAHVPQSGSEHLDSNKNNVEDLFKHRQNSGTTSSISILSDSYRRRVFFKYERKLRMLSPPQKVFDYFASVKLPDGQAFMTATDLMRAVVPVFPPSESDVIREGSLPGEKTHGDMRPGPLSDFFMLFDTNGDGLISFNEYLFLVTLLSIPQSSFSAAVRMFDIDGNGTIDKAEFQKMMEAMRSRTKQVVRAHEKIVDDSGLVEFFFGRDGKKLLKHEEFEQFLRKLHEEITRLEFSHYDYSGKGTISVKDFGLSMVASADLSQLNHYLDCVEALGNDANFKDNRVTYEEFCSFAKLRKHLQPLEMAINSYGETYGLLTKSDFQRAASQVCKVPVTDNVVDVVFYIFDTNKDGSLSSEEFLGVMERREKGMSECLDSGIISFLSCWWNCGCKCSSR